MKIDQSFKNNPNPRLSKKETDERGVTSVIFQDELFNLWRVAIIFFNDACDVVKEFPEHLQVELLHTVSSSALAISINISRASYAETKEEACLFLEKAVDADNTTMGSFRIFRQLRYINEDQLKDILEKGKAIEVRLRILIDGEFNKK